MKNTDYQAFCPCTKVEYTHWGVNITAYLSLKPAVYKVLRKHWNEITLNLLHDHGVFNLVESYKKGLPSQLVNHREIRWSELSTSPGVETWNTYHTLNFIKETYQRLYKAEIKDELYKQYITFKSESHETQEDFDW